jgi:hypothetical protein
VQYDLPVDAINPFHNAKADGKTIDIFQCHQAVEIESRRGQHRKLGPVHPESRTVGEVLGKLRGAVGLAN